MLEVVDLTVRYGQAMSVLHEVSLSVPDGSIVTILGANGAGKTTLLRTITGTLGRYRGRVERGAVRFSGRSLLDADPAWIARCGVAHVPEGRRIFGHLSVAENLRAAGALRPRRERRAARDRMYAMFPVLARRRDERAGMLSGGEQQMLAIARALVAAPSLLLLDEPSLGLAPKVVEQVAAVIREIRGQGVSVMVVEQNAAVALGVADIGYVLNLGRVGLSGPAGELSRSDEVRHLYLGHPPTGLSGAHPASSDAPLPILTRWAG